MISTIALLMVCVGFVSFVLYALCGGVYNTDEENHFAWLAATFTWWATMTSVSILMGLGVVALMTLGG